MSVTNDIFEKENKHHITIFMIANYKSGEVVIMEPENCKKWEWFKPNNLPTPLFLPLENYLKEHDEFKPNNLCR